MSVYVLDLQGQTYSQYLYCSKFWNPLTPITPKQFFWEAWLAPRQSGSRYWLSDGYGGAHAALFGFAQNGVDTQNRPRGNFSYDGTNSVSFDSDDGAMPDQWCHVAFSWDGQYVRCHLNGIVVGRVAHMGNRMSPSTINGGGNDLFIGGSDHNNYDGKIAQVRGFDVFNPLNYPEQGFLPDRFFGPVSYDGAGTFTPANIVLPIFAPGGNGWPIVPDLSPVGYLSSFHPGIPDASVPNGTVQRGFPYNALPCYPLPTWVEDEDAPFDRTTSTDEPPGDCGMPPSPPAGALVFDSFNRGNCTMAWHDDPQLGCTESGSLGVKTWQNGILGATGSYTSHWGILNGRATCLGTGAGVTWVDLDRSDFDVRVDRTDGPNGTGQDVGLCWRVKDRQNCWTVFSEGGSSGIIYVADVVNGVYGANVYNTYVLPSVWTTLRVVCNGTTFTIYADGTQIAQLTGETQFEHEVGAGLFTNNRVGAKITSASRYDNFVVFGV